MALNKHELQAIAKAKGNKTGISYRNFREHGSDRIWREMLTDLEKRGFLKSHQQQIGTDDQILMYNLVPELEFAFEKLTLTDITAIMCICEDLV